MRHGGKTPANHACNSWQTVENDASIGMDCQPGIWSAIAKDCIAKDRRVGRYLVAEWNYEPLRKLSGFFRLRAELQNTRREAKYSAMVALNTSPGLSIGLLVKEDQAQRWFARIFVLFHFVHAFLDVRASDSALGTATQHSSISLQSMLVTVFVHSWNRSVAGGWLLADQ